MASSILVRNRCRVQFLIFFLLWVLIPVLPPCVHTAASADSLGAVRNIYPAAQRVEKRMLPVPHLLVYDAPPPVAPVRYGFVSTNLAPKVRGFGGPIEMLVLLDHEGAIRELTVYGHKETPAYTKDIQTQRWLKQFVGKTGASPLQVKADIQGVTGATISSRTVCLTLKKCLVQMNAVVGRGGVTGVGALGGLALPWIADAIMVTLLFILAAAVYLLKRPRWRWLTLIVGFFYLGVYKGMLYSISHIKQVITGTLPAFELAPLLWIFLVLILVSLLLCGRLYCGYLCPFGAIQEVLALLSPWRLATPTRRDRVLKWMKFLLLGMLAVFGFVYKHYEVSHFEPFAVAFRLRGPAPVFVFLAVLLMAGLFIERFYCRYFCPAGASLALLNMLTLFRLRRIQDCRRCNICIKACPTKAIDRDGVINFSECVLCNKCRVLCPDKAFQCKGAWYAQKKTETQENQDAAG